MRQIRVLIAVAGLVIALVPIGARAQTPTNEDLIAQNRAAIVAASQQANLANDLARCHMASVGSSVPGTVGFSQPNPGGCTGSPVSMVAPPGSAAGTCVAAMRALTKAEFDKVNEFAINAADAIADGEPLLMPPADITALTC